MVSRIFSKFAEYNCRMSIIPFQFLKPLLFWLFFLSVVVSLIDFDFGFDVMPALKVIEIADRHKHLTNSISVNIMMAYLAKSICNQPFIKYFRKKKKKKKNWSKIFSSISPMVRRPLKGYPQPTFTCSKSTMEAPEHCVKFVVGVVLVSLLLTLNSLLFPLLNLSK